jgi:hypothetical protein
MSDDHESEDSQGTIDYDKYIQNIRNKLNGAYSETKEQKAKQANNESISNII